MCRQSCWLARVNEVIEQAFCNHPVTYALYISCHTATVSRKYHDKISLTIENLARGRVSINYPETHVWTAFASRPK